jgi:serine/threonine-protein kinase HipA
MELKVYYKNYLAGVLTRHAETSFSFYYLDSYLGLKEARPISVNLPLQAEKFESSKLFPFFDNLLVDGWLLSEQSAGLKIDPRDRFALISHSGLECIGAVSLRGANHE